jgi:hypothetical protein
MAKYKIIKGSFGINSDIYKAGKKNDIIESDKDLSIHDGIEKFKEVVEKKVVNIAPEVEESTKKTAKTTELLSQITEKIIEEIKEPKAKKTRKKRSKNKSKAK